MRGVRILGIFVAALVIVSCASQPKPVAQVDERVPMLQGQLTDLQKQIDSRDATIADLTSTSPRCRTLCHGNRLPCVEAARS